MRICRVPFYHSTSAKVSFLVNTTTCYHIQQHCCLQFFPTLAIAEVDGLSTGLLCK